MGEIFPPTNKSLQTDKYLAAFLLVRGLIKNEWEMVNLQAVCFYFS
jgi:hypothetical protein